MEKSKLMLYKMSQSGFFLFLSCIEESVLKQCILRSDAAKTWLLSIKPNDNHERLWEKIN